MAKPVDYSRWDHIEISDDEDDTHPNVDTPSLFRWRHQARVERMEHDKKEKEEFEKGKTTHQQKQVEIKQKLKEAEDKTASDELSKLQLEASKLSAEEDQFRRKEEELKHKEKMTPLNIDTICRDGKSKTIINKSEPKAPENLTEDQKWEKQQKFTSENDKLIKKFGMLKKYEDSQEFLSEHPHLVCEETANYLVIWCVNLEVQEKNNLMCHVSHQTIIMQFILELAKSLEIDPRNCIRAFFSRIKLAEKQYMHAFNDELNSFKIRVKSRAEARIADALKEVEEEEKQERMGPGGLDPVEVFETLPQVLKDCFESKDLSLLQKAVTDMPREEAEYHMKRCVESGLWVPGGADKEPGDESSQPEEVYDTIAE